MLVTNITPSARRASVLVAQAVNFYKHHLGDYDGATAHLSWEEDLAYRRLLSAYYRREAPIPVNPAETYRLVRAVTASQKRAVTTVLHEFFTEQTDGWHNKRADEETTAYQAQANTNRRIARGRTVERTVERTVPRTVERNEHEASTKRTPNQEPLTKNHKPRTREKHTGRLRPAVSLPENFEISEGVKTWAQQKGFDRLEAHFEHFIGVSRAKGYAYADWDQALMNAVRDDWAGLRANGSPVDVDKLVREIEEEEKKRAGV